MNSYDDRLIIAGSGEAMGTTRRRAVLSLAGAAAVLFGVAETTVAKKGKKARARARARARANSETTVTNENENTNVNAIENESTNVNVNINVTIP